MTMTIDEVRAWLKRGRKTDADYEIKALEMSVNRLRDFERLAREIGAARAGGVEEYAKATQERIDELKAASAEVQRVISQVSDGTQRRILEYRYIHGLTNEDIADEMSYCAGSVNRYHRRALQSVCDILERDGNPASHIPDGE